MSERKYWLMKSEPNVYSIDQLRKEGTACWEGVRNYQARNFMRDDMKEGDLVFFYHSNVKPTGIVGLAQVVKEAYPDHFAWDKNSKYFDKKSSPENPRWFMVDVGFVEKWKEPVTLEQLKKDPTFEEMLVTKPGMRLSIQPVEEAHFNRIVALGREQGQVR